MVETVKQQYKIPITKVVYTELNRDDFDYLYDKDIIRYTDYNTYEILSSDIQEILQEMQNIEESIISNEECSYRLNEIQEIRSVLNDSIGSDIVDMLDRAKALPRISLKMRA